MNFKQFILSLIVIVLLITGCKIIWNRHLITVNAAAVSPVSDWEYEAVMKRDILCLMLAYPETITGVDKASENEVYVLLKSRKKILYDDKKKKLLAEIGESRPPGYDGSALPIIQDYGDFT